MRNYQEDLYPVYAALQVSIDRLWMVDGITPSIRVLDQDGMEVGLIPAHGLIQPIALTWVLDQIWVVNRANSISRFWAPERYSANPLFFSPAIEPVEGQAWVINNGPHPQAGQPHVMPLLVGNGLNDPRTIAFTGNHVYVGNAGNATISRFLPDGRPAGAPLFFGPAL